MAQEIAPPPFSKAILRGYVKQIQAAHKEEQINPPRLETPDDCPRAYESINLKWLDSVITPNFASKVPGARLVGFQLDKTDIGTTERRRIFLEWNEAGQRANLPTTTFCKGALRLGNRLFSAAGAAYTEWAFYKYVRPHMPDDCPVPEIYHAGFYEPACATIIMMRDVAPDATFLSYKRHFTQEMWASQLRFLAKMHAKFYESKEDYMKRLYSWDESIQLLHQAFTYKRSCDRGFEATKHWMPARFAESNLDKVYELMLLSGERASQLPKTLTQGDLHPGNWYQLHDGRVGLSDWQNCSLGHWSRDVVYVIASAVDISVRRREERDALRYYLHEFAKAGGPYISEQDAWLDMRLQIWGVFSFWFPSVVPSPGMPPMQPLESCEVVMRRLGYFAEDHDCISVAEDLARKIGKPLVARL